jgi:ketosteroid isomerase-like protein
MTRGDGIQEAIDRFAAALPDFVRGDPTPFSTLWSHGEDVTIFGGWGAYERGWDAVGPRLAWAAGRFAGGQVTYKPLAAGSSGDLGYAIGLERGETLVMEGKKPHPLLLRVTHLFRREEGQWKLIHRHADPIVIKTAPEALLQV